MSIASGPSEAGTKVHDNRSRAFFSALAPAEENILSMCWEVATAEKLWPAVTAVASSPGGRLTCQSLLAAQLSKGRYMTVLEASLLERLPYITPCMQQKRMLCCTRHYRPHETTVRQSPDTTISCACASHFWTKVNCVDTNPSYHVYQDKLLRLRVQEPAVQLRHMKVMIDTLPQTMFGPNMLPYLPRHTS